jgi:hypothetical protein
MIDAIFYLCVAALVQLADIFGVTYEAINVWLFCVIWPIGTLALCGIVFYRGRKIAELEKELVLTKAKISLVRPDKLSTMSPRIRTWRYRNV